MIVIGDAQCSQLLGSKQQKDPIWIAEQRSGRSASVNLPSDSFATGCLHCCAEVDYFRTDGANCCRVDSCRLVRTLMQQPAHL